MRPISSIPPVIIEGAFKELHVRLSTDIFNLMTKEHPRLEEVRCGIDKGLYIAAVLCMCKTLPEHLRVGIIKEGTMSLSIYIHGVLVHMYCVPDVKKRTVPQIQEDACRIIYQVTKESEMPV